MKSRLYEKVKPKHQTTNKFYELFKNSFIILPDGKTIIGVSKKNQNTLKIENIITNKAAAFGKHNGSIQTLLYDKVTGSLFVGDKCGQIKQYKRGSTTLAFTLIKNYEAFLINSVISSEQLDGIVIFGGFFYSIFAINIRERRRYKKRIRSPFESNVSFQVCHGLNNKVYLSIGGSLREYNLHCSDFLDVTKIYQKHKMKANQNGPEVNKMLNIPSRKDQKINLYHLKIKQGILDLPQKRTPTKGTFNKKK